MPIPAVSWLNGVKISALMIGSSQGCRPERLISLLTGGRLWCSNSSASTAAEGKMGTAGGYPDKMVGIRATCSRKPMQDRENTERISTGSVPIQENHPMDITERRTAEIITLSVSGKLDTTSAKKFEEKVLSRIDSGDRRLVIDLAQLDYISSAGLRVLIVAGKRLSGANGKIVLCSLKDPVREVFDIAGFSSIFSVYGSHDEAVKNL